MINLDAVNSEQECDDNIQVLQACLRYAMLKKSAIHWRTKGNLRAVEKLEAELDEVYKLLPDWAKW